MKLWLGALALAIVAATGPALADPSPAPSATASPVAKEKGDGHGKHSEASSASPSSGGSGQGGSARSSGDTSSASGSGGGSSSYSGAGPSDDALSIGSTGREFYVLADGDREVSSALTLGVAFELSKVLTKTAVGPSPIWTLPEPSWSIGDVAKRCKDDPQSVGAVVLTFYSGFATHFYLLWQAQTTTTAVFAQLLTCGTGDAAAAPALVGIVNELPGAHGTPWVVRKSQLSVPLISLAAIGTLLAPTKSTSKTTEISIATVAGSLFTGAGSRDIPGYSDPLRLRDSAQHLGDDLYLGLKDGICGSASAKTPAGPAPDPKDDLCRKLGFAVDQSPPATVP